MGVINQLGFAVICLDIEVEGLTQAFWMGSLGQAVEVIDSQGLSFQAKGSL